MGITNDVLDTVVDALLDSAHESSSGSLQNFEDFVVALSADSGLPEREVQSCLVKRMLLDPRYTTVNNNVTQLGDYRHLIQVN